MNLKPLLALSLALGSSAIAEQALTPAEIFQKAQASSVIVLSGEGAGRLEKIATAVVISKDGVLLTAYHAIKGAAEVQVRTAAGEIFDRVELLGVDERRDVAALKISGGALPVLPIGTSSAVSQGDPVYAVTNAGGLSWSATQGIIAASRMADEVPGAGNGFRLLQFTAPIAPGASGGALVDGSGSLIGIITGGLHGGASFAVPIEGVLGLPQAGPRIALGSGRSLQLPAQIAAALPQSSAAIAGANSNQILKTAKTLYVHSKTSFLTVDTLDRALLNQKQWPELGLTLVQDARVADLLIEIDRPIFTYVHTFVVTDKKTSIILGSGKVTAFDGTIASPRLASEIVKVFVKARVPTPAK